MIGRVQKLIANAGVCSRRKAEDYIRQGLVTVNGKIAKIGDSADSQKDRIVIAGRRLEEPRHKHYIILNKPPGVETTLKSESRKPTVVQLAGLKDRVIPAGRLDTESRGLVILTNDGELAHRIMHPSYPLDKVYSVKIRGIVPDSKIEVLRTGVQLEDGMTSPCEVKVISKGYDTTKLAMTLHEGRKREIRRMIEAIGFNVLDLIRVRVGPLTLRGVPEGRFREIKPSELKELRRAVRLIE